MHCMIRASCNALRLSELRPVLGLCVLRTTKQVVSTMLAAKTIRPGSSICSTWQYMVPEIQTMADHTSKQELALRQTPLLHHSTAHSGCSGRGSLLGPYSSEAKGEVGDHGTDEATPIEAELASRCHGHSSLQPSSVSKASHNSSSVRGHSSNIQNFCSGYSTKAHWHSGGAGST